MARIDRRMSPNQTALWTFYELRNLAGQRHGRVRLACYYRRSAGVNHGHPRTHPPQVRGAGRTYPLIFQAGRVGSIPVTRSRLLFRRPDGVLINRPILGGVRAMTTSGGSVPAWRRPPSTPALATEAIAR